MAAGTILTVLANVPWGQVIDAAPKVADSATKLWKTVRRNKNNGAEDESDTLVSGETTQTTEDKLGALHTHILGLESEVQQLRGEMNDAAELIKSLADQNTALIQRVEINRRQLRQVTLGFASICVGLACTLAYVLLR